MRLVKVPYPIQACRDPRDDKFLEVAVYGEVQTCWRFIHFVGCESCRQAMDNESARQAVSLAPSHCLPGNLLRNAVGVFILS